MLLGGINQFAVINEEEDEVVVLKRISSESTYDPQIIGSETTTGEIEGGADSTLEVVFYDSETEKIDKLTKWMIENVPVQVVGVGYKGALMWYEAVTISNTSNLNPNARDGASTFTLRFISVNPFQDVKVGINLFKAAAYKPDEGRQPGGTYQAKRAVGGAENFSAYGTAYEGGGGIEFLFPFEGVKLTFDADASDDLSIIAKSASATLATETDSEEVELTTPANTYKIELSVASGSVSDAVCRLDGKFDFIDQ